MFKVTSICVGVMVVFLASRVIALPPGRHPVLLYEEVDIPVIKDRIEREPYASWWAWIKGKSDEALSKSAGQLGDERQKTRFAKALAFAYMITQDSTYAQKAIDVMKAVKFPPRGGNLGEPHAEAEGAANYFEAYDMLYNYLRGDLDSDGTIRAIAAEEADRLYGGLFVQLGFFKIPLWQTPHKDNWHIRAYSALGMGAIVLSDYVGESSTPDQWDERARSVVMETMDYQIDANGGYAEGPFYSQYAADIYMPYLLALKRFSGEDLLNDSKIHSMHDWSLNIRLPDGSRPNVDDAHLSYFFGNYLSSVYPDGAVHAWDWGNARELYAADFYRVDAIVLYDDSIEPGEPDFNPTIFMPEAGDAVFRSDWSRDAIYMLLRGEHGKARTNGLSHEHPDGISFIIFAYGEMLALDAGYIEFAQHHKVNKALNHNLILVDGKGPPLIELLGNVIGAGVDATISNFFSTNFLDYAEVKARYQNTNFVRSVFFADNKYFVIIDDIDAGAVHTYEWLLHGNGGGTSGGEFESREKGVKWRINDVELIAYIAAPNNAKMILEEGGTAGVHSFSYRQELTHTVLKARASGEDLKFLSVLYPKAVDSDEPEIIALAAEGGRGVKVNEDVIAYKNRDSAGLSLHSLSADNDTVRTDGEALFVKSSPRLQPAFELFDRNSFPAWLGWGSVGRFSVLGGRFLKVGSDSLFSSSEKIRLALDANELESSLEGYFSGQNPFSLKLWTTLEPDSVYVNDAPLDFSFSPKSDILTLNLQGQGTLKMVLIPVRSDFNRDRDVGLGDFVLFLDVFGSSAGTTNYSPIFDLDEDGEVGLSDFVIFLDDFGSSV